MDNLESGTYEVFEKDPVKYREYQNAIHHALVDRVDIENVEKVEVVVMVLGAGRGPLVRATLRVSLYRPNSNMSEFGFFEFISGLFAVGSKLGFG